MEANQKQTPTPKEITNIYTFDHWIIDPKTLERKRAEPINIVTTNCIDAVKAFVRLQGSIDGLHFMSVDSSIKTEYFFVRVDHQRNYCFELYKTQYSIPCEK